MRISMLSAFLFSSLLTFSQQAVERKQNIGLNLLVGFQSFPGHDDMDAALQSKNYTPLQNSWFTWGGEFAVIGKNSFGKAQLRGEGIHRSGKQTESRNISGSFSLQYGYYLLKHPPKSFVYPFGGVRFCSYSVTGISPTNGRLHAPKSFLDLLAGVGVRQLLDPELRGLFNNIDLNAGFTIPLTNGLWANRNTDAAFVRGTMDNEMTFFVTLSLGKIFRNSQDKKR